MNFTEFQRGLEIAGIPTQLAQKPNRPPAWGNGNITIWDSSGNLLDQGFTVPNLEDSVVSKAAAGRTQMGVWHAGTNTPTLVNPPAEALESFYEVIAPGTLFGITWAVGDYAMVAQSPDGTKIWSKRPAAGDIFDPSNVFCSAANGADTSSGTQLRPKKTISSALSVVSQPGTITLTPGAYGTTGATLTVNKQNILVVGRGVNGSNQVNIQENYVLAAARFRLANVNIDGTVTWSGANGGHQLQGIGANSNHVFIGASTATGFAIIADCDYSSAAALANIRLDNLNGANSATLYLTRANGARLSIGSGWTVIATDCINLQVVSKTGTLITTDDYPVMGLIANEADYTALSTNLSQSTDGYYIVNFTPTVALATAATKGDIVLKQTAGGVATLMALHKSYLYAPPAVYIAGVGTYQKSGANTWSPIAAGVTVTYKTSIAAFPANPKGGDLVFVTATGLPSTEVSANFVYDGQGNWVQGNVVSAEFGSMSTPGTGLSGFLPLGTLNTWTPLPATVQIPSAGEWEVIAQCDIFFPQTSPSGCLGLLVNGVIDDSQSVYFGSQAGNSAREDHVTGVFRITTTGPATVQLAQYVNFSEPRFLDVISGPFKRVTRLSYKKISGFLPFSATKVITEPITIVSTITAPVKSTTKLRDYITIFDDGSGWCRLVMHYLHVIATSASSSSGTYLFKLPGNYKFDPSYHFFNLNSGSLANVYPNDCFSQIIIGSWGGAVNNNAHANMKAIAHGESTFKLVNWWGSGGQVPLFVKSDFFQMTTSTVGYEMAFTFKKA